MERVVIVAPNWLGDAVMALPAIADVRSGKPDASIAIAARASVAPLFSLVPGVELASSLSGFDTAILLPNSFNAAMRVARAGIPERWGYRTDWRGMLLTRAIDRAPAGVHQIDYYRHLVASLGFVNGAPAPRLEMSPDMRAAGAALLKDAGWDGRAPLVAIAPGAAYGSAKRWPPAAFADLGASLAGDGVAMVMVGAPADRATAAEVTQELRGRATLIDVVGQTDIPALAAVLSNCRALVANDSGALHLGAALGLKVTAVFGPTDERISGPRSHQSSVTSHQSSVASHQSSVTSHPSMILTHHTWCRPCGLRECPLDHACMLGVSAAEAAAATRNML